MSRRVIPALALLALLAAPAAACPFLRGAGGARALAAHPAPVVTDPAPVVAGPARRLLQAGAAAPPVTAQIAAAISTALNAQMATDPKLMPHFVRLGFHDSLGPGGADGAPPRPAPPLPPLQDSAANLPSL